MVIISLKQAVSCLQVSNQTIIIFKSSGLKQVKVSKEKVFIQETGRKQKRQIFRSFLLMKFQMKKYKSIMSMKAVHFKESLNSILTKQ